MSGPERTPRQGEPVLEGQQAKGTVLSTGERNERGSPRSFHHWNLRSAGRREPCASSGTEPSSVQEGVSERGPEGPLPNQFAIRNSANEGDYQRMRCQRGRGASDLGCPVVWGLCRGLVMVSVGRCHRGQQGRQESRIGRDGAESK